MGDWVFGCDVCQEVCPFNRDAPVTTQPDFAARHPAEGLELHDVLAWSDDDYATSLRGSAMKRATLPMLKRNSEIALRNIQRHGTDRSRASLKSGAMK
jgi:epoxyqueuosine reductase